MTLNAAYFSRPLRGLTEQMNEGLATLRRGGDEQTAYVFFDDPITFSTAANISPVRLRSFDGFTLYLPRH